MCLQTLFVLRCWVPDYKAHQNARQPKNKGKQRAETNA